jgi:hypothetical protein
MEFWLGLALRYRLPRRKRVESPALALVRNPLLGRPLRLNHLLFPSARGSTKRPMAAVTIMFFGLDGRLSTTEILPVPLAGASYAWPDRQ